MKHDPPQQQVRRGFSLIELLVTITIIAILASLLMVMFRVVRDMATATRCGNILRQIQLANIQYSMNWDGQFVPFYYWPNGQNWTWNRDILDNLDMTGEPLCPLAKNIQKLGPDLGLSFGMNFPRFVHSDYLSPLGSWGISNKVAFADTLNVHSNYWHANPNNYWVNGLPSPEGFNKECVAYRHRRLANAVFFDGHLERLSAADLYNPEKWY